MLTPLTIAAANEAAGDATGMPAVEPLVLAILVLAIAAAVSALGLYGVWQLLKLALPVPFAPPDEPGPPVASPAAVEEEADGEAADAVATDEQAPPMPAPRGGVNVFDWARWGFIELIVVAIAYVVLVYVFVVVASPGMFGAAPQTENAPANEAATGANESPLATGHGERGRPFAIPAVFAELHATFDGTRTGETHWYSLDIASTTVVTLEVSAGSDDDTTTDRIRIQVYDATGQPLAPPAPAPAEDGDSATAAAVDDPTREVVELPAGRTLVSVTRIHASDAREPAPAPPSQTEPHSPRRPLPPPNAARVDPLDYSLSIDRMSSATFIRTIAVDGIAKLLAVGLVAMLAVARLRQRPLTVLLRRPWWKTAGLGALVLVFAAPALYGLIPLLIAFGYQLSGSSPPLQPVVEYLGASRDPAVWIVGIVSVALVAPLVEEFVFRGLCYTAIRRVARPMGGVLISSALFALPHGVAPAMIATFALGCVLAVTFERTRSLIAPIVIHAVFNLGSLAIIAFS